MKRPAATPNLSSLFRPLALCGLAAALIAACSVGNSVDPPVDPTATGGGSVSSNTGGAGGMAATGGSSSSMMMIDPTCRDSESNGEETDVDCGGKDCPPCANDKKCSSSTDCESGLCTEGTCSPCATNDDCTTTEEPYCKQGVCSEALDVGAACEEATDCKSGFCPTDDKLCCDAACDSICTSCKASENAGADGTCGPIEKGTDPGNECPGKTADECRGETCDGGGSCTAAKLGTLCNTSWTCDGQNTSCPTTCTTDNQCAPNNFCYGTTCGSAINCKAIKTLDPMATTGPYTIDPDGQGGQKPFEVWCNMAGSGATYESLAYGPWNVSTPGYQLLSLKALQLSSIQEAFVFLYNKQGGFMNLNTSYVDTNCCFKVDSGNNFLQFGPSSNDRLFPCKSTGVSVCNEVSNDPIMRFRTGNLGCQPPNMAINFFAMNPPNVGTGCTSANNPGIFMKIY